MTHTTLITDVVVGYFIARTLYGVAWRLTYAALRRVAGVKGPT